MRQIPLLLVVVLNLAACRLVTGVLDPAPAPATEPVVVESPADPAADPAAGPAGRSTGPPAGHAVGRIRPPRRQPAGPSSRPRFWTWQKPMGRAAAQSGIIQMVNKYSKGDPRKVAEAVCNEIVKRRLGDGEVCILLQGFGMGDGNPERRQKEFTALFNHWCDGVRHRVRQDRSLSCERIGSRDETKRWWPTLWMSHGIEECDTWMSAFIARYRQRQAADRRIPDPARFHFDSEDTITPFQGGHEAFAAMRDDPRWATEPIPGHGGKTIARLYRDAGDPKLDPSKAPWDPVNRAWTRWYMGIAEQANDGAMNEAAYERIRAAWPDCKSSNYDSSARADGLGTPGRFQYRYGGHKRDWLAYVHDSSADLQAPVLYWTDPSHLRPGESLEDATVRLSRTKTDTCIHSWDGPHWDVVPWIEMCGTRRTVKKSGLIVTKTMMRDMLAMLNTRGVSEFILWSNETTQRGPTAWNDLVDAIAQVWRAVPRRYEIEAGSPLTEGAARLRYARKDPLSIVAAPDGGTHRVSIAVEMGTTIRPPEGGRSLEVRVEAWTTGAPATVRVMLLEADGGLARIIDTWPLGNAPQIRRVVVDDLARFVAADGTTRVRIELSGSRTFTANIDAVHVFVSDAPAGGRFE